MSKWTQQEKNRAVQWANHGRTAEFMAARLGKSVDDVAQFLQTRRKYGGVRAVADARACLKCRRNFSPRHKGLFLCDPCKSENASIPASIWPVGNGCSVAGAGRHG